VEDLNPVQMAADNKKIAVPEAGVPDTRRA